MLIGLGTAAGETGFRVMCTLATPLVNELVGAARREEPRPHYRRYGRVDLLMIDELGYMELDRRGAELLFRVLTVREENNAIAIASERVILRLDEDLHRPPPLLTIVDRLTLGGTILETGTDSHRLAHTHRQQQQTPL